MSVSYRRRDMNRISYVLLAVLMLSGCATMSTVKTGPNGKPIHHIEGLTVGAAYERAAKQCPDGYNIIHKHQQGGFMYLDIECK
jgi:hypothetical protein